MNLTDLYRRHVECLRELHTDLANTTNDKEQECLITIILMYERHLSLVISMKEGCPVGVLSALNPLVVWIHVFEMKKIREEFWF